MEGNFKRKEQIDWPRSPEVKYDPKIISIKFGATSPDGKMYMCDLKNDVIFERTPKGKLRVFLSDQMHGMKKVKLQTQQTPRMLKILIKV